MPICFSSSFPGKPEITHEEKLKDQTLKAGSSLIILVNITGSPEPKVTWFKDDQQLTATDGITIETSSTGSTLTVKGLTGTSSGTYKVVAENEAGSASAEFNANIKGTVHFKQLNIQLYLKDFIEDVVCDV